MSIKNKIIVCVLLLIAIITGLVVGLIWKDLPLVKFNSEIKLIEVANFILTMSLGIVIPFMVKKWIEDNRSVKAVLVDEIKNILSTLNKIKTIIDNCHTNQSISKEQKDEINFLFHETELQISSLEEQYKISFSSKQNSIISTLKTKYFEYKDYLTGGELMLSTFTNVDSRFYREHKTKFYQIETCLKLSVHSIHKL